MGTKLLSMADSAMQNESSAGLSTQNVCKMHSTMYDTYICSKAGFNLTRSMPVCVYVCLYTVYYDLCRSALISFMVKKYFVIFRRSALCFIAFL